MAEPDSVRDVNHIQILEDFVQDGIDYLPGDFLKQKENFVKFLTLYLNRLETIDKMMVNLSEGRLIANATNVTLDEIGRRLGVERNGLTDDSYRASIMILLASSAKHGTRPEVIGTLGKLFGEGNFKTWKGDNYRADILVMNTCFPIEDLLEEIKDILPLPTHLRLVESQGRPFGFSGKNSVGFSSVTNSTSTTRGGIARLVYTSDEENTNKNN
jgi:hypothetical protein